MMMMMMAMIAWDDERRRRRRRRRRVEIMDAAGGVGFEFFRCVPTCRTNAFPHGL